MATTSDKSKVPGPQTPAAPPAKPEPLPVRPGKVPPLFRLTDWVTFLLTFAAVWIGYYLTLAPELTLEDSGELATGSFYAGIPHPPGYPVWTIYTWLWTVLVPFKNVAWRVALGEATGGALAAGLLGLLVSRGSSLLMEGIEELKAMGGKWANIICLISGFVAGTLVGYNGFMWSQSVIVEVYSFGVASLMVVLLFLLRWIYAPHQRRYLYLALFFHGICFTNHQTLIVAAMGIEVAIAAADFRMGRSLWLGNSVIYFAGLILKQQHMLTALDANQAVFNIFNVVGVCSIAAYFWFAVLTKETFLEFCLDVALAATVLLFAAAVVPGQAGACVLLGLVALGTLIWFSFKTHKLGLEWLVVIGCGLCWIIGAGFYFYMPLAGMTDPPMQWGYPRTVEGFIHAFTRGQYEKANPTDIIHNPAVFAMQLMNMGRGIVDEFNWVYVFLAFVPFVFFRRLHRRERAWLTGITAIYLCLGVLLLILLNPPPDRAAQELNRVFFTASHTLIALLIGYGLTVVAAYMATHYQKFRYWGLIGGAVATALAILSFAQVTHETFFGEASSMDLGRLMSFAVQTFTDKHQYGLPVYAGLILIGMCLLFLAGLLIYRDRAPLAITLAMFALMPLYPILTHWSDNEQRDHWFGYWFGHDMFTPPFQGADGKPLYPEMAKDTILFGGTDPGRFCPTYMIFCDSFIPSNALPKFDQKFDRRDVYLITQNALADGTYLNYLRAQYNRSQQIDPPFFQELFRSERERQENYNTNFLARAVKPLDTFFIGLGDRIEKQRRTFTSWFTDKDFVDLAAFAGKVRNAQDPVSKFIHDQLSPQTVQRLGQADDALRAALCQDLNRLLDRELQAKQRLAECRAEKGRLEQEIIDGSTSSSKRQRVAELDKQIAELSKLEPFYTPERFKEASISEYLADFIKENPQGHTRVRLNRLLLEAAYPKELAKSLGGVYPDREIYIPSPEDSQRCFQDYLADAQRRLQQNQLKPGEDVRVVDNRVQVSGQVAVMSINGLLTKVIFDRNPKSEFYVEESFPLDWMFDYLTPFGIIMKINRQPVPELTEEIVRRDHEFWSQYSTRLIGNWITYDTPVKDIADFVERVYLRRNFAGFKGDRKFVRDDQAQKAFSKLRSSIGGVYNYRIARATPGSPEQQRMIKEADFAFRQALAFCPYSPEAVFRYVNLLLSLQRFDDALLVASTCLKLDPYNAQVIDLVTRLQAFKKERAAAGPPPVPPTPAELERHAADLEKTVREQPANLQAVLDLAAAYIQLQQIPKAVATLDRLLNDPQANASAVTAVVQACAQIGDLPHLEKALEKLVKLVPDAAEAWYDLAAVRVKTGRIPEALAPLGHALDLSAQRRARDPKAADLLAKVKEDSHFAALRDHPEFKKLIHGK